MFDICAKGATEEWREQVYQLMEVHKNRAIRTKWMHDLTSVRVWQAIEDVIVAVKADAEKAIRSSQSYSITPMIIKSKVFALLCDHTWWDKRHQI